LVDQVTRGDRNTAMQDILNTLDGGNTKNMNVIALFTTNHIELIEPTFLRGKRIGSIISLGCLDAETAKNFFTHAFGEEYELDIAPEEMDSLTAYIEKNNIAPAFMAEIIEAVKSTMVFSDDKKVKYIHLKTSVDSYLRQVSLSQKKDMSSTPEKQFTEAFAQMAVGTAMKKAVKSEVATILYSADLISEEACEKAQK